MVRVSAADDRVDRRSRSAARTQSDILRRRRSSCAIRSGTADRAGQTQAGACAAARLRPEGDGAARGRPRSQSAHHGGRGPDFVRARSAWTATRRSQSNASVEAAAAGRHVTPLNRVFWLLRLAQFSLAELDYERSDRRARRSLRARGEPRPHHHRGLFDAWSRHLLHFALGEDSAMEANIQEPQERRQPDPPARHGCPAPGAVGLRRWCSERSCARGRACADRRRAGGSERLQTEPRDSGASLLAAMLVEDGSEAEALATLEACCRA